MNRSKRLNTLRPLKMAFSEQVHLLQPTIFFFLLLDGFPDGSFIPADRRNRVSLLPRTSHPRSFAFWTQNYGRCRLYSSPSHTPPRPKRHTFGGWKPAYAHDSASDGPPPLDSLVDAPALEVSLPDTGEAAMQHFSPAGSCTDWTRSTKPAPRHRAEITNFFTCLHPTPGFCKIGIIPPRTREFPP